MPMELNDDTVVARAVSVSWCDLGDEVVVLRVRDQAYYRLQESARALWLGLGRPCTVAELAAEMCRSHDGDPAEIMSGTLAFVQHCTELDLVIAEPSRG